MTSIDHITLSRGVRVTREALAKTLAAVQWLRQEDPTTLFALREHALDSGYPLSPGTLATLRRFGLAEANGVAGPTRAVVADAATGHGWTIDVEVPAGVPVPRAPDRPGNPDELVASREGIDADLSTTGWLRLALNAREEAALREEVAMGRRLGIDMRVIGPAEIRRKYALESAFAGRLVLGNGNFHPFKFVVQEVRRAVERGVRLYTRTKVTQITSSRPDRHEVRTDRGTIVAKRVIVAINAFTSELFPQLGDIRPFRSQIVNYNHVANTLRGITFTAKDGDIYGNFPAQDWYVRGRRSLGTLHLGGGLDTPFQGPWHARPSPKVYRLIVDEATRVFPGLAAKAPVRTWAGPMAFVEGRHGQRMPVIGVLGDGPQSGVLITVWCNGYGGTGCHKTGAEAARWALTGTLSADVPEDVFGVRRLLSDQPMSDEGRGGPKRAVGAGARRTPANRRPPTAPGKPVT